jgi:GNAT superfamily N-acetyltransferase
MPDVEVVVTHLVMDAPSDVRPPVRPMPAGLELRVESPVAAPRVAAWCYRAIGGPWHWVDRLPWAEADWNAAISAPGVEVVTLRDAADAILAYAELAPKGDDAEIRYFGVVPDRLGEGIGGGFLAAVVTHAWQRCPARVVLNTCSLDGPAALPNYLARGFRVEREERVLRMVTT